MSKLSEESVESIRDKVEDSYSIKSIGTDTNKPKDLNEPKQKRVMSEAQLDNLRKAREKAAIKRKEQGELKLREKKVKEDLLNERIKKIENLEKTVKPKKKVIVESDKSDSESSTTSEESSSSEEEVEIKPKPKTKITKYKPTPIKQKVASKSTKELVRDLTREELETRINQQIKQGYMNSLFAGLH